MGLGDRPIIWMPTRIHPQAMELANQLFDVITPSDPRAPSWTDYAVASLVRTGGISAEEASKADKLRIITRNGVGVETLPLEICRQRGIVITNLPGHNAKSVAELCLGLTISVRRRITEFDRRLRRGETLPSIDWMAGTLDNGKVVGLVGMGNIAREVAKKFVGAFESPLLVYSPTTSPLAWTSACPSGLPAIPHTRVSSLDELISRSDVISLHCPLLPETENMFSVREFKMMKKSSILINTARGHLVDETALIDALTSGEIAGAGLDALRIEPPSIKVYKALMALENVIVLPHAGAGTEEIQIDACIRAVRTIDTFLRGEGVFGSNIVC